MGRFRDYKNYRNSDYSDSVSEWEDSYSNRTVNKIPNKTIIRTLVNYLKFGSASKRIHI